MARHGPGYTNRNGRAAWLALLEHYEGGAQRDCVKDVAYLAISQARYHGDCKCFSFETYVTIHQDAYEDLEQYGQVIPPDKRVRDLLQGIKDLKANAAKETILANNHLRNDFSAVTHLATSLQLQGIINEDSTRNVSGMQSGRGNQGQGKCQGGRGGGCGRGRGRGRNIYLGSYSPKKWAALSKEEKQRVQDGGAASTAAANNQSVGSTTQPRRNIASVTAEDDAVSAITAATEVPGWHEVQSQHNLKVATLQQRGKACHDDNKSMQRQPQIDCFRIIG
jgi:hypothetical protein